MRWANFRHRDLLFDQQGQSCDTSGEGHTFFQLCLNSTSRGPHATGPDCTGPDQTGVDQIGFDLTGLIWTELEWNGTEWKGMKWNAWTWSDRTGLDWSGLEWNGIQGSCSVMYSHVLYICIYVRMYTCMYAIYVYTCVCILPLEQRPRIQPIVLIELDVDLGN